MQEQKYIVYSTNRLIFVLEEDGMLLMYRLKSKGEKQKPCGTPADILYGFDIEVS